jgi:hypothetical protein
MTVPAWPRGGAPTIGAVDVPHASEIKAVGAVFG